MHSISGALGDISARSRISPIEANSQKAAYIESLYTDFPADAGLSRDNTCKFQALPIARDRALL
jgi:hypothetical protein